MLRLDIPTLTSVQFPGENLLDSSPVPPEESRPIGITTHTVRHWLGRCGMRPSVSSIATIKKVREYFRESRQVADTDLARRMKLFFGLAGVSTPLLISFNEEVQLVFAWTIKTDSILVLSCATWEMVQNQCLGDTDVVSDFRPRSRRKYFLKTA